MKLKRSHRLVAMTNILLKQPHTTIPLTVFGEQFQSAKSSISEDLVIIKETFEAQGIGKLLTTHGASGGVSFVPFASKQATTEFLNQLGTILSDRGRVLPGGYLYMTDILGDPSVINEIGRIIATPFWDKSIDAVMTVETKGIPLAYAAATQLQVPVVIVRKSSRVTEGSTVSINYVSGSSKRIQTMVLPRRSLKAGENVLVIDDFMKAGGTMLGMTNLISEFEANLAGMAVLVETKEATPKLVDNYLALLRLNDWNEDRDLQIESGNFLDFYKEEF
ncbi:pur operon repressor [Pullulanibacillus sp. KACC 23026]|uniref:pur operon repressor n=1 Tax=Pullulanibacillus sp. KACC 23026 TaxID=3028315 RepID=UPI0023B095A8|nr:pur operon repressor [Pullulanibacillus sp. KACC 23026]WEG12735.1 pur operon repressor [Pullulanibacillus sp. KACC 23026]